MLRSAMQTRLLFRVAVLYTLFLLLDLRPARAAPEAHILRIDPRASQTEGAPVLTTVFELVQKKRLGETLQDCAALRGDAQTDCQSERLEAPGALYASVAFPAQNAFFTVLVNGQERPASLVSSSRWGESLNQPGVGTAWLILVDAGSAMGSRVDDAKFIASAFVRTMSANDIVNVMFFNDRQVAKDSKWQTAASREQVAAFINSQQGTYPSQGRVRPLFNIIRQAATDGFRDLGGVGSKVPVPLHQAMVVLSSGTAGADASSTGPGAATLSQYLSNGRFPEDNVGQPKTPVPVISVWLPVKGYDEMRSNAEAFMQGMANTEIGGFYDIIRPGQGEAKAPKLVSAVRTRFNQMHIAKWRVSCVAPTVTQTFRLMLKTDPPMMDASFKDVPVGIDPSTWPLDINVQYTQEISKRTPVQPGGQFTVFGNFCWGGDKESAEVYFVSARNPPPIPAPNDIEALKRAQQQMVASGLRGKAIQSSDTSVVFEAPDKDEMLYGQGNTMAVRLVVYDNKSHRASNVGQTMLTLTAAKASLPWLYIGAGAGGGLVVILLIIVAIRAGGSKKGGGSAPAPVVPAPFPGGPAPNPGYGGPVPGAMPDYGAAPGGYGANPGAAPPYGAGPGPGPGAAPPYGAAPGAGPGYGGAPGGDMGYGGPAAGGPGYPPAGGAAPYGGNPMAGDYAPVGGGYGAPPGLPDYGGQQQPPMQGQMGMPPAGGGQPVGYGGDPGYGAPQPQQGGGGTQAAPVFQGGGDMYPPAQAGNVSRATLSGSEGVYTVAAGPEMRVGRDASRCQIVLGEPRVSGMHASLKVEGGAFFVRDEQSNNGSYLNGNRLAPGAWTLVPQGSVLKFGPSEFMVQLG